MMRKNHIVSIVPILLGTLLLGCSHDRRQANFVPKLNFSSNPCEIELLKPPRTKTPLVKVAINGHEGIFILDTGSDQNIVSITFADKIGLRPLSVKNKPFELARIDSLMLGAAEFLDFDMIIYDMANLSEAFSTNIDGIVGGNILCSTIYELNFREQKLTMFGHSNPAKTPYTPVIFNEKKVYLPVEINGNTMSFLLDTGAAFTRIAEADLERINIKDDRIKTRKHINYRIDERVITDLKVVDIDSMTIGSQLSEQNVRIKTGKNNLLGMNILSSYTITVDPFLGRLSFVKLPAN